MMIFLASTAGVAILVSIAFYKKKGNHRKALLKENIPENLGFLNEVPSQKLRSKLEHALSYEYVNQVKIRFLSEHPEVSEDEFEWRMFELKRYFLLNSIMKNTPMFSVKVDEIWHEMLMFTKQYEVFSNKYLGKMLHHTPNLEPEPAPQERAFFDWVFTQMFEVTEYTWRAWGAFFQNPMDPTVLKNVYALNAEELKQRYFKVNNENEELVNYLIRQLKKQILESEEMYIKHKKGKFTRPARYGDLSTLSMCMVFYSYYYFDDYWLYAKDYAYASQTQGTSGCSAVFCGTGDSSHDSHDGNSCSGHSCSSSCSSSSCSSCGGGCS
ncbi:hypothetical protein AABM38_12200 [Heyndrickxia sp. MSNUG]|uniref:hypothetical protein n=1 Tax=Heyndrickxia sp. MSNUG TaxID=3136677 RepID=UPI003C2E0572